MVANPSGLHGPTKRTSRWRPKTRLGWLLLLLILALCGALIWEGVSINKRKAASAAKQGGVTASPVAAGASAPATPASAIQPPPVAVASAPATVASSGKTAAKAAASTASQPKAPASKPATAKEKEMKEARPAIVDTPVVKAPKIVDAPAAKAATAPAETPPQGKPYLWTRVGADPCNPKVGCNLAWALEQSKWPADVQSELRVKARDESPVAYTMRSGWTGWMTWGKHERKFRANTLAQWPSGQTEASDLWSVARGGVSYNLVRVQKCKNWGGFTAVAHAPARPLPIASPGVMPLGVIPTVACPDETE